MDHSATPEARVTAAGWTLSHALIGSERSDARLTAGPVDAREEPGARRGPLGAVAETGEEVPAAEPPARIAILGLADGFYNARPTLGQAQALTQALLAINRWMFAIRGADGQSPGAAASLSAVVFDGARAGLLQIGGGIILRRRESDVAALAEPQLRRLPDGRLVPRRSLGADSRLLIDYIEEPVMAGDRYILISGLRRGGETPRASETTIDGPELRALCGRAQPAEDLARAIASFPEEAGAPQRAVLVVDVEAIPLATIATTQADMAALPVAPIPQDGETRDDYRIGRTLHRGAYTLLKQAVDLRTRQTVVLKFPLPAMLHDRVFQAGFARESWIGATVHSPVIARVIPPEPDRRSSLYIVMPYYAGETLEARIAREPRLPVADIVAITLQLCRAVEDLRAVQALHRDLKPENVMLVPGGGLRLLDLGLAYLPGVQDDAADGLAGTIRYLAPELLRGAPPDDRTEVYALGVILYRLAALGRFPRPSADVAASVMRTRPDLPPELARIAAAALSPVRDHRPAHAGAVAQAVSEALQHGLGSGAAPRRALDPVALWRAIALVLGVGLLAALALR